MDVHNSFICDSQKLETVQMFERIDERILGTSIQKIFIKDKLLINSTTNEFQKFQNNYTKLKEVKQKWYMFCDSIYIKF